MILILIFLEILILKNDFFESSDENIIDDIELSERANSDDSLSHESYDQSSLISSLDISIKYGGTNKNNQISIDNDPDVSSFSSDDFDYNPSYSDNHPSNSDYN